MISVGIDDTDTLDDPGTNQLARHLVRQLQGDFRARLILRHQLLEDPRVPCTKKNGCAAIEFSPRGPWNLEALAARIRELMIAWCPKGSDPGLAIAVGQVPQEVIAHGRACQRRLVTQGEARQLARRHAIYLQGLGGTEDGVIGALAAVGLRATRDDGRVVFLGEDAADRCEITGLQPVKEVYARGVDEVRCRFDERRVNGGTVDLGKRLRPNYRNGQVVLYVSPAATSDCDWVAERVV